MSVESIEASRKVLSGVELGRKNSQRRRNEAKRVNWSSRRRNLSQLFVVIELVGLRKLSLLFGVAGYDGRVIYLSRIAMEDASERRSRKEDDRGVPSPAP